MSEDKKPEDTNEACSLPFANLVSYFLPSQGGAPYLPSPRRWWHGMKESQLPKTVTPQPLPAKVRKDAFYRRIIPRILP